MKNKEKPDSTKTDQFPAIVFYGDHDYVLTKAETVKKAAQATKWLQDREVKRGVIC